MPGPRRARSPLSFATRDAPRFLAAGDGRLRGRRVPPSAQKRVGENRFCPHVGVADDAKTSLISNRGASLVTKNLELSRFPGIDLLGGGLQPEGFCVVVV